jgi:hypothetical protein
MKRKRPKLPPLPEGVTLKDASCIFERTIVAICREGRMQRRFTPADIDLIIRAVTTDDVAAVLEEFAGYLEREDWDALVQLAARERTRRMIRGVA